MNLTEIKRFNRNSFVRLIQLNYTFLEDWVDAAMRKKWKKKRARKMRRKRRRSRK